MKLDDNCTLLVNSCDSFEDCWNPFFRLFSTYWERPESQIILNTELKTYNFPGLDILCSQVNSTKPDVKLTWSECLIEALNRTNTQLILYMQEDYFIEKPVDGALINEMVQLMINNAEIKYIGLTRIGSYPPFYQYDKDPRLMVVSRNSRYRISLQAGLWRKEVFLSYLRSDENAWMFEIFGTMRSRRRNELFLILNRELYNTHNNPVLCYEHTGIVKSKWHPRMPFLFEKHGINIDFTIRGIYKQKFWLVRKLETIITLIKNPVKFISGILGK
jgi:hypothetical protein